MRLWFLFLFTVPLLGEALAEVCSAGGENWKPAGRDFSEAIVGIAWPNAVILAGLLPVLWSLKWRPAVRLLGWLLAGFGLLISWEWRDTIKPTDPFIMGMIVEGCRSFYSDVVNAVFFSGMGVLYLVIGYRMPPRQDQVDAPQS